MGDLPDRLNAVLRTPKVLITVQKYK